MFHANVVQEITLNNSHKIDLVGFHGQTMFHSFKEKKSKQLGDANLLHQLTKKKIVYNFRANDILDGGQGAPLTPIFHHLLIKQKKINLPTCILNIGGIANITAIKKIGLENIRSKDIGPGNCLIDEWVRKNSNKNYDEDGKISSSGNINEIILEQAFELFLNESDSKTLSLDTKDFDVSFVRGLSLEDGAATLTELTSRILSVAINSLDDNKIKNNWNILLCGGGRKNKDLIKKIKNNISKNFQLDLIDKYEFDGDFIESQAFAYLAIRSFLSLPLSFPNTTGCKNPCAGGDITGI
jgi:anhydro-N-acetylmuramic acid kinase